ncbi:PHA/PHB synthase family protein [Rhizobium alvei]|uniref:Alpha/beta fold hydrolase n=1 Tax=Rhizobium alvei TaxID=1132659 RepID=A0ABT8YLP4_9HYPH|nr:alpha/beta fold hydrolase [Rhizobium alvei]MDO6964640.1 alpha/beta fold hydrolase [Rhizobium alvei]
MDDRTDFTPVATPDMQATTTVSANEPSLPAQPPSPNPALPLEDLDREIHAFVAKLTGGLSPIAMYEAFSDWMLHLLASPGRQQQIGIKGTQKLVRLQHFLMTCATSDKPDCVIDPLPQDHRFKHEGWKQFPFNVLSQSFLLTQQWWHNATDSIAGVMPENQRLVEFFGRQWLDVFSPSNYLLTNPEILERTAEEQGANLLRGASHFAEDLMRQATGQPTEGTEAFKPGETVAVTPGEVIFRNDLIELIQYRATTPTVRPEPVLIVPAWIMKYYILDLSPENSLIRHLVDQGFTVFSISWRNPDETDRDISFDDYRTKGILAALDAIEATVPGQKIHATGYCLGGTKLAITAAAMARDGDERLASLSFFAAQVDFEEPGELGLFITEGQIAFLESLMWRDGYLDQSRMAGAFQMLRSQDLIWSRMIRDYMMGDRAAMTDLMAWNADATRMPYRMHSEYLRHLFKDNELAEGRYRVDGRPVYLEDITVPVFSVATVSDHVAPWRSVFKMIHLLDTDTTFVLTSGGHNAGIVSEPGHPHRSYQTLFHPHGSRNPDPDRFHAEAPLQEGSWWPRWTDWLNTLSGADVGLPPLGNVAAGYPILGPAPGTYVFQR